jgi:hypothetical protein
MDGRDNGPAMTRLGCAGEENVNGSHPDANVCMP